MRKDSVKVKKVAGTENPADLMTKFLGKSEVVERLRRMGLAWKGTDAGCTTWWAETDDRGNEKMICSVVTAADDEKQKGQRGLFAVAPKGNSGLRQVGGGFAIAWAWGYPSPVNLDSIPGWQGQPDPHCLLTKCQRKRIKRKDKKQGKAKEKKEEKIHEAKDKHESIKTLVDIVPEGVNALEKT